MKLFAKKPEAAAGPPPKEEVRLLVEAAVLRALDYELTRATRYGRPFAVLRIVAHLLPSELPGADEIQSVGACISGQLRDVDRMGTLDDGSFVALLPETDEPAANVAAGRISSELTLRSGAVYQRNWLVGAAELWPECESADALLVAALANAIRGRGRAAA